MMSCTCGARRRNALIRSRNAAACGLVTTPIILGNSGSERLRVGSNKPSDSSLALSRRKASYKLPIPALRITSTLSWKSPRAAYSPTVARTSTLSPSRGLKSTYWARLRNITARTWAPASFRVKYQCPEAARVTLEISPLTHASGKLRSSRRDTAWFSCVTVSISAPELSDIKRFPPVKSPIPLGFPQFSRSEMSDKAAIDHCV